MLFQGEEWGAASAVPVLHRPRGRRRSAARSARDGGEEFAAFGWDPADVPDPQDPDTFARSKLDWTEPAAGCHASLIAWYRELIRLRRQYAALTDPRLDLVRDRLRRGRRLAGRTARPGHRGL